MKLLVLIIYEWYFIIILIMKYLHKDIEWYDFSFQTCANFLFFLLLLISDWIIFCGIL